jgi:hypothetical protein
MDLPMKPLRVLIASDESTFMTPLAEGFSRLGYDVVCGVTNFFLKIGKFDIVLYLWPEEYTGWGPPAEGALQRIEEALKHWERESWPVLIANNSYPHGYEGDPRCRALYDLFYKHSQNIVQYSRSCYELACRDFPSARGRTYTFSNYCAYHELRNGAFDRDRAREELGFKPDDFVILIFGTLRFWEEVKLLMQAYSSTRVPRKRLLILSPYREKKRIGRLRHAWRTFYYRAWLRLHNAVATDGYTPNEMIERYFVAADVLPILRLRDMYSGLTGMGLTFGKLIVAPNHEAYPELLKGTQNIFYNSGDAWSLANALQQAASLDREEIGVDNLRACESWTWENIAQACVRGFPDAVAKQADARAA